MPRGNKKPSLAERMKSAKTKDEVLEILRIDSEEMEEARKAKQNAKTLAQSAGRQVLEEQTTEKKQETSVQNGEDGPRNVTVLQPNLLDHKAQIVRLYHRHIEELFAGFRDTNAVEYLHNTVEPFVRKGLESYVSVRVNPCMFVNETEEHSCDNKDLDAHPWRETPLRSEEKISEFVELTGITKKQYETLDSSDKLRSNTHFALETLFAVSKRRYPRKKYAIPCTLLMEELVTTLNEECAGRFLNAAVTKIADYLQHAPTEQRHKEKRKNQKISVTCTSPDKVTITATRSIPLSDLEVYAEAQISYGVSIAAGKIVYSDAIARVSLPVAPAVLKKIQPQNEQSNSPRSSQTNPAVAYQDSGIVAETTLKGSAFTVISMLEEKPEMVTSINKTTPQQVTGAARSTGNPTPAISNTPQPASRKSIVQQKAGNSGGAIPKKPTINSDGAASKAPISGAPNAQQNVSQGTNTGPQKPARNSDEAPSETPTSATLGAQKSASRASNAADSTADGVSHAKNTGAPLAAASPVATTEPTPKTDLPETPSSPTVASNSSEDISETAQQKSTADNNQYETSGNKQADVKTSIWTKIRNFFAAVFRSIRSCFKCFSPGSQDDTSSITGLASEQRTLPTQQQRPDRSTDTQAQTRSQGEGWVNIVKISNHNPQPNSATSSVNVGQVTSQTIGSQSR